MSNHESSAMAMDLIHHIAGLYSGKAIKGDFTQIYITGNEIWMAQQILASQQRDQAKSPEQAEISQAERDAFEAYESKERRLSPADQKFWFRRGVLADYDCKAIDDAWKAWKARAAMATPCTLRSALEQAHMALIGYLPAHRNEITDAAIKTASAALGCTADPFPSPERQSKPCGECHLQDGERCDICGALQRTQP